MSLVARWWLVVCAAMVPTTLSGLSPFMATVALDHIGGALSAAPDEVTWAVTAHIVAYSIMLPVSVWLSALVGGRRLFALSILVFSAGSALAGAAPNLTVLILGRVLQGMAGGCLVPISQLIMMRVFPEHRRAMALAIWSLGIASGSIFGPALGGFVTEALSWRWLFHFNVPLGLGALLLLRVAHDDVPENERSSAAGRLDLGGLAALVIGIASLQTMLQWGQREGWWTSPTIVGLALVAALALAGFVWLQLRLPHPIMDLGVFRNRTFAVGCLLTALLGWCQSSAVVLSSLFSMRIMDHGALLAGMVLAPGGVGTACTSLLAGGINTRVDPRLLSAVGTAAAAWGMAQLAGLTPEATFSHLMWPRFIVGFGFGCLIGSLATATLGTLSTDQTRRAVGAFNLLRNLGGSVGIAVMGSSLERGALLHQAHLGERMDPYFSYTAPTYQLLAADLAQRGGFVSTATRQSLAALSLTVRKQGLFLSFVDSYRVLAVLLALSIPLLLVMQRARRRSGR